MAYPPPPYADAVCGTHLCGEAICGAWWAYPPEPGLLLGGYLPEVIVLSGDIVPPAGLLLGAWVPDRVGEIDITVVVPAAGIALGAYIPSYRLSTTLLVSPAGLLLGAYVPDAVGVKFLTPLECLDLGLVASPERELVLAAVTPSDLDLDPLECL